jgi:hypothetical protein
MILDSAIWGDLPTPKLLFGSTTIVALGIHPVAIDNGATEVRLTGPRKLLSSVCIRESCWKQPY